MKYKLILFCVSFLFISIANLEVQACKPGDTSLTHYMRRDNNRCEGIKKREPTYKGIKFISLVTRNITNFNSELTLHIPKIINQKPQLIILSHQKPYTLDRITPQSIIENTSFFSFKWSTYVLKQEKILPKNLRARAWIRKDSQDIYLPVKLGKTSGKYEFVLFSDIPVTVSTLEIRPYKSSRQKPIRTFKSIQSLGGEISFNWDARSIKPGLYRLKFSAKRNNSKRIPRPQYIIFEHNPQWLK